jgi:hypothetical protein
MTNATVSTQAIEAAFEAGKASALAQLASGKPVLMVDEMGLSDLDFANVRGWNSVFGSPENGKVLSAFKPTEVHADSPVVTPRYNEIAGQAFLLLDLPGKPKH